MNSSIHSVRQSGAALVVSMILLMVLTVLAVSTMSTASLEVTMAGNDQFQENAFQLAETGIGRHMADITTNAGKCTGENDANDCDVENQAVQGMGGNYTTVSRYVNRTLCPSPSSLGEIYGYNFEVTSTGETNATGASSAHTMGWYICRR